MDVPETDRNVTPKWQVAALALASGQSATVAGKLADVTPRTIKRWRRKERFRQLVDEYRAAVVDQALGKLTENATRASDVFAELMSSQNEQVKLAAARAVLDYRSRLHAEGELSKRVEELSLLVGELTNGNQPTQSMHGQAPGYRPADGDGEAQGGGNEPLAGGAVGDNP